MSGICGVWTFDEATISLAPILAKLEQRGPDGTREWSDGAVALGHASLATTPEALVEHLPFNDAASGCTITADARLDNRDALIGALGLSGETRTIGDGELILRAYLEWGDDCPKHLLGDFAFAIWDARRQRLFCARDQMGMRQLIYHHAPGRLFAFATDAEALVAHPAVPRAINEARVADFLDNLEGADLTSTFYAQVVRLPPAHRMTIDREGCVVSRYWSLELGDMLMLDSDEAYAAAFHEMFTTAVECRLRSASPIGSMLSGGLDTNSVAAVAAGLLQRQGKGPLATFSAIRATPEGCVESGAILRAIESPSFDAHLVNSDDSANVEAEIDRLENCREPFDGEMVLIAAVYRIARAADVKVVLDGVSADVVLTAGNRVAGLLKQGRLIAAMEEARRENTYWGPAWPVPTILASAAWAAFSPRGIRRLRWRLIWAAADRKLARGADSVSASLARSANLRARRATFRRHRSFDPISSAEYRRQSVLHPHLVVARERYDRVAAGFGIEPRDPFMDVRLVQFCLSLPPSQLQADGWPKIILRRAMARHLPKEIAWKPGKQHVGAAFTRPVYDRLRAHPEDPAVKALLGDSMRASARSGVDRESWFKLVLLSKWLSRISSRDHASPSRK